MTATKTPDSLLTELEPSPVWSHFAVLCAIPRPSLHEAALREHLIDWARGQAIETTVDPVGNLILRKPASPGCESRPGLILQGHLDMVCQANAGTRHDFQHDPIRVTVRDGWVVAEQTTLGADNGIGVALALAALQEPDLVHPPLEVLLTVNEESGMDGARGLEPGSLLGQVLINLDTEEWGHFYLGCAGGVDVEVSRSLRETEMPPGYVPYRLDVTGLRGGHSGIDIHLGRGNAIKLLVEALRDLAARSDLRLIRMEGGTARNAIPREASALFALPAADGDAVAAWLRPYLEGWQARFAGADPGISLTCERMAGAPGMAVTNAERDDLLTFLADAPCGVAETSEAFSGVVETSDNLGIVTLADGRFGADFLVRSLREAGLNRLADSIVEFAARHGMVATKSGAYPGWTPNPESPLLARCQQVYIDQFGQPAKLQVIHAGLECGLLAASHPQLDMISFGPDICGAHAPGERVEIASVARCWQLLKAVLRTLAAP